MPEEKIIFTYDTCDYLTREQWEAWEWANARLTARKHDRQRKKRIEQRKRKRKEEIKENIGLIFSLLLFSLLHLGMFMHWLYF